MFVSWTRLLALSTMLFTLTACSMMPDVGKYLPDRKVEYKKERQAEEDLEIPPDLTQGAVDHTHADMTTPSPGAATYSDYLDRQKSASAGRAAERDRVLPRVEDVRVARDGDLRWLVVQAPVEEVWRRVIAFWQESGIALQEQDPLLGILRTRWIENRAGQDAAAVRDQYRVRLEEGEAAGSTELYLTHRGMAEQFVDGRPAWVMRPTDHDLEAEMLRRIMIYFGLSRQQADQNLASEGAHRHRSRLLQGQAELEIAEPFSRAWRITGMALDRGGFAVEDRDRTKGIYYVRYHDPMRGKEKKKGLLSRLAFWRDDGDEDAGEEGQYQVRLHKEGEVTRLTIQNDQGVQSRSDTARRILGLLHEQIK